jgi:glycosyltransferase involved in cell wall biosynthesis
VRIVFVIGSLRAGGSERQVVALATGMRARGHDVAVVCLNERGPLEAEAQAAGVQVVTLGLRISSPLRTLQAAARYTSFLRRFRPDVVYGFLFWGSAFGLLGAALVTPRAALVSGRRHEASLDAILGHPALTRRIRRLFNSVSDAVIANAPSVAASHAADDPRLEGRIAVIHNAVGVTTSPREVRPGRILCVANFRPVKRHDDLLAAVARLPPSLDWELLLVGEGPMRAAVEAEVRALPEPARVTLLGWQPDVGALLRTAAVLALSSEAEGSPNAVLEAMAAGVPVVATAVGSVPELLAGGAGIVVPIGDPEALAAGIERYLGAPAEAEAAGRVGRAASRRYGADVAVERHLAIFEWLRRG